MKEGTPEFQALCELVRATENLANGPGDTCREELIRAYREAQTAFCRALRQRRKPAAEEADPRWLITDFITLGCPLTHAEFLLASSAHDLESRKEGREFPTSPPLRERLDPDVVARARRAGLPLNDDAPRLFCFPFGTDNWQLHHAAPYAAVRWTNIYDPARLIFFGDIIAGAVAPAFGPGVIDIDLRSLRGQSWRFTHTQYWSGAIEAIQPQRHIVELREALDLAGQRRLL